MNIRDALVEFLKREDTGEHLVIEGGGGNEAMLTALGFSEKDGMWVIDRAGAKKAMTDMEIDVAKTLAIQAGQRREAMDELIHEARRRAKD